MIVLDTNVISELMRDEPSEDLLSCVNGFPPDSVWITAITSFELRFGVERLPSGRRRARLEAMLGVIIDEVFGGRVLAFDRLAAEATGRLVASRERDGVVIDLRDAMIAGIVLARAARLLTRNTKHFPGVELVPID